MRKIALTGDMEALVDDDMYDHLMQWKWRSKSHRRTFYALSRHKVNGVRKIITMHSIVLPPTEGRFPDHINGNGLDNRRENLRLATQVQNAQNAQKRRDAVGSKYKGVGLKHPGFPRPWSAEIKSNKNRYILGSYETEIEAAIAYDIAARLYHGEFARLNFPAEPPEWRTL